jgi:hypothetical protein
MLVDATIFDYSIYYMMMRQTNINATYTVIISSTFTPTKKEVRIRVRLLDTSDKNPSY